MKGKIRRKNNFFLMKAVILTFTLRLKVPPTAQGKRITILGSVSGLVLMMLMMTAMLIDDSNVNGAGDDDSSNDDAVVVMLFLAATVPVIHR